MSTTLLAGSGAVRNSWAPVNRALKFLGLFVPDEGANFVFSTLVFQLRSLYELTRSLRRPPSFVKELRDQRLKEFQLVRSCIGYELLRALEQEELTVRPELKGITDRFGPIGGLITTNWDDALDTEVELPGAYICHLHGYARNAGSLYLPSETHDEPYRLKKEKTLLREHIAHASTLLGRRMKHLIVWGLSLSPLDIELGRLLATAVHTRRCRITVIDPRAYEVAQRIRVQCPYAPIYYGTPDQLYLKPDFSALSTRTVGRWSKKQALAYVTKALEATSQRVPVRNTSLLVPIKPPPSDEQDQP
jgi:hypothetical protein